MLPPLSWPRKSALKYIGGIDETLSEPGECGIWGDWELSTRMWLAGFQVLCKAFSYFHLSMVIHAWSFQCIYRGSIS